MTQSTHSRLLDDYEKLLANSNAQSNLIVNPINELVNAIPKFANSRNAQSSAGYYQTYQSAYGTNVQNHHLQQINQQKQQPPPPPPPPKLTVNQLTNAQQLFNQQQLTANQQLINQQQLSNQQYAGQSNDLLPPVSNSSTASTALLQPATFQTTITSNGLTKLTANAKSPSSLISLWPLNRKPGHSDQPLNQTPNSVLNSISSQPAQLISKLNFTSFTYHLLTCALIVGIVTLLLIVISSIYIYSSYANRVSKSVKLNEIELCSSIDCQLGATCKVDVNYKQPYCDCEQFQCDNVQAPVKTSSHHSSTANNRSQIICGSDNKTYSLCELRKASCLKQKRIEIQYYSACVNRNADPNKLSHANSKLLQTHDKGKEDTFITSLFDSAISADVNLLLNDPLAKQDACNQLGCSFASSCQIRNVSLSTTFNNITSKDHLTKKVSRLVCECPAKCSLYDHLITELVAEANIKMVKLNRQQQNQHDQHYSGHDDEYSSAIHQSASAFNYAYEQMRNSVIAQSGAVFGSNAKDYKNLCELAKASCASQTRIQIKYFGLCDPCASHQCAEDEICKLKPNRQPYCDCGHKGLCSRPQKYQNSPEHVCGSDGNSYLNECVLRRHTCVNERNVTIISNSECVKGSHPCHKIHCNAPMECHVSPSTNQATCECSQHCSSIYKPVCGLDNRTYDSACHLALETCLRGNSQPRLGLLHQGVCGTNVISKSVNHAVNGKTMSLITINEEEHGNAINQFVNPQSNGNQQCAPNTCPNYGICLLAFVNGVERITCECPTCAPTRSLSSSLINSSTVNGSYDGSLGNQQLKNNGNLDNTDGPVCSSDGVTFASECELRKYSCEQQKHITIKHKGACHICKKCKHYSLCETTASEASKCVCPESESCEKLDAPVCSSDGVTYENECELRVHSCKLQKLILVRSVGPCNACEKIKCKFGSTCKNGRCSCPTYCDKTQSEHDDLLCASNGRTFANDCDLKRYACLHQTELSIIHLGECDSASTKRYGISTNESHNDSVEAGVRLINDEENEDEFNVILRQQSAEDESSAKNSNAKHLGVLGKDKAHQNMKNHQSNGTAMHNKHSKHHRHKHLQHVKHHSTSAQQAAVHRKQRNQLCRKLKCRYGSMCKLDQIDLNQTKFDSKDQLKFKKNEENVEVNRISLEVTAYCDCSHINCDLIDKENEELCGSDGKLYLSTCQMKEKACKLQSNIQIKQRSFCDSNDVNSKLSESIRPEDDCKCNKNGTINGISSCLSGKQCDCKPNVVGKKCDQCLPGHWGLGRTMKDLNEDDSSKSTTNNKQSVNQVNELDLLFDNYVFTSDNSVKSNLDDQLGCLPCECNSFGSMNGNCNQTTGQCMCKYGVVGEKCDYCEDSTKELTDLGCVASKVAKPILGHCNEINCLFNASCELVGQTAQCKCDLNSVCRGDEYDPINMASRKTINESMKVCGHNNLKYPNECELKMHMCLIQEEIRRKERCI